MKEPASARRAGDLSSPACLTRMEVRSRKTASMSGWFKRTAILTNPSGVPICNFSSCLLPTKGAFSIPKIAPPAPRTTEPNLLSASIKLVMPSLPTFEPKAERPAVFHGRRVPRRPSPSQRGWAFTPANVPAQHLIRPGLDHLSEASAPAEIEGLRSATSWSSGRAAVRWKAIARFSRCMETQGSCP